MITTILEFATARQVREAIRLFQVSTLAASKSGMIGESMGFIDSQTLEEINNCEDQIKRRVPRGERVSLQAIGAHQTAEHFESLAARFGSLAWAFSNVSLLVILFAADLTRGCVELPRRE